jgi:hypothetical protein
MPFNPFRLLLVNLRHEAWVGGVRNVIHGTRKTHSWAKIFQTVFLHEKLSLRPRIDLGRLIPNT